MPSDSIQGLLPNASSVGTCDWQRFCRKTTRHRSVCLGRVRKDEEVSRILTFPLNTSIGPQSGKISLYPTRELWMALHLYTAFISLLTRMRRGTSVLKLFVLVKNTSFQSKEVYGELSVAFSPINIKTVVLKGISAKKKKQWITRPQP